MRILPNSRQERVSLALFPFKVYPFIASLCLVLWGSVSDAAVMVVLGFFLCAGVLILAALVQVFTGPRGAALFSIGFGALAFVWGLILTPMLAG